MVLSMLLAVELYSDSGLMFDILDRRRCLLQYLGRMHMLLLV